jgi:outer membrane immunogenic protein
MRRSRLASAALAAIALSGPAFAADPSPPGYNWTGAYVGIQAGYGFGDDPTKYDDEPTPLGLGSGSTASTVLHPDPSGVVGGGTLGYNVQANQVIVFGVEGDFSGSGMSGTQTMPIRLNSGATFPSGFLRASESTDWFGTIRGRIGLQLVDRLLFFGTAGLAVGHVRYSANIDTRPVGTIQYPASLTKTLPGWVGGGGIEWAFLDNWSFKAEGLFYDLGNQKMSGNPQPPHAPYQAVYKFTTEAAILRAGINYRFW